MSDGEFNYSLGVLIVLLIVFWSMCKCIGNNHQHPYQHNWGRRRQYEPFSDSRLLYGNTPVALSESPIPYIRMNKSDTVLIPNSKSAYRHLTDYDEYKCGVDNNLDTQIDNDPSSMFLKKKKIANQKKIPSGMTTQRKLQDNDRMNRVPMPSY